MQWLLILLCAVFGAPVVALLGSWLTFDPTAWATLTHQTQTVLPQYAGQSLLLTAGVGVGVALVGVGAAVVVTLFRFPGRSVFEWAMLLPMAMPGYVLAYAYTDALQFSGSVQTALRSALNTSQALWPDVRSLGGAIVLFVLCLYPYVYLLTRAALSERGVRMMEAARLLGAGLGRRLWAVALPLARPAVAAGVALALMETLADYGVGSFFGLSTFTTGIYRAWLSMNDPTAAAQLATVLLLVVGVLLLLERRAQSQLRFNAGATAAQHVADAQPVALHGLMTLLAVCLCALPLLLGFVLPVMWLLIMLWHEAQQGDVGLPWPTFIRAGFNTLSLAAAAAVLATMLSVLIGFFLRRQDEVGDRVLSWGARVLSLGYAVPGAVVAIGILWPLGWVQHNWPQWGVSAWMTGTVVGVLYAYGVRFSAVSLQTVEAGYARLPYTLDETARLLGGRRWRIFTQLHLPLLQRSVWASALLVFVDVMKELPATLVLRPLGSDTLAVVAYNLARDERLGEAALPSLAIVAVGLIPVMLLSRAMKR